MVFGMEDMLVLLMLRYSSPVNTSATGNEKGWGSGGGRYSRDKTWFLTDVGLKVIVAQTTPREIQIADALDFVKINGSK